LFLPLIVTLCVKLALNLFLHEIKIQHLLKNLKVMKTIAGILLIVAFTIFSSCEGPVGPVGPPGEDGVNILGSVFRVTGDFTAGGNYTLSFTFPNDFEVFDSDIVLVYLLWESTQDGLDVWQPLPYSIFFEEGVLQYNYDYTLADVQIYLEGTIPFNELLPSETDNQIFRIAVLPADFAAKKSIDISDLNAVMKSLDINPNSLKSLPLNK
jgi:hypothetical protein